MNKIIKFENHPEIGEYIFSHLDWQSLLSCQFVCQDWKQVLQNPYFWLKKLTEIGQSNEIDTAWKNLITKAVDFGVTKSDFAECLQKKYKDFNLAQDRGQYLKDKSKYYLKCPPLFTAANYGHIEIVKLIYKLEVDFNRKIYWVPNPHHKYDYYELPIFAALLNGHVGVVKFLVNMPQELQNPPVDVDGTTLIVMAFACKKLEMVKILVPLTPDLNSSSSFSGNRLIHFAIRDYKVFQYMMSQPGIDTNLLNTRLESPLQVLCDRHSTELWKIPPQDVIKMVEVLAPLADRKHACDKISGPIQRAARHGLVEVLKILILNNFDVNIRDKQFNYLPIDSALSNNNVEIVRILHPLTKLELHEEFKHIKLSKYYSDDKKQVGQCETPCKKIRIELREDHVYELPFKNEFDVYTKDQIERMIYLFKQDQSQKTAN